MKISNRISLGVFAVASLGLFSIPLSRLHASSLGLDAGFQAPFFTAPDFTSRVLPLPDGKYVVYRTGRDLAFTDQRTGAVLRFFADGTFDSSFDFNHDFEFVGAAATLADGRLIVSANQEIYGLYPGTDHIFRLKTDGSIDSTFNSADATAFGNANSGYGGSPQGVRGIAIQPDGKILLGGAFGGFGGVAHPGIVRLLSDGTLDPSFAAVTLQFDTPNQGSGLWTRPALQSDGKIVIAGDFDGINGVPVPAVARLNEDGTLDTTFNPSGFVRLNPSRLTRGLGIQTDGKIVLGGNFLLNGDTNFGDAVPVVRLNTDGSLDQSYIAPPSTNRSHDLIVQADNKVLAATVSVNRYDTNGSLDPTFVAPSLLISLPLGFPSAFSVGLFPDQRILLGGGFSDIDDGSGISNDDHWSVARLFPDGSLDPTFATSKKTAEKAYPTSFLRQFGGSTLVAFDFVSSYYAPVLPHNFGRLLPNGTLDSSFDPVASFDPSGAFGPDFQFTGFVLCSDGELLAWGQRDLEDGFGTNTYGKLFADLTEDTSFTPDPTLTQFGVFIPLADGGFLVTDLDFGAQSVLDNVQLRRLDANGALDATFHLDPAILANTVQRNSDGVLTNIAIGGKILGATSVGRIFLSYLAVDDTFRLVRLNSDGSLDPTFASAAIPALPSRALTNVIDNGVFIPEAPVTFALNLGFTDIQELDGSKLIVTGDFATYAGKSAHGIVRLNSDGSVDTSFASGGGAQWTETAETDTVHPAIDNIEPETDGKFLITGTFEAYDGVAAPGIATLNPDGSFFESLGRIATRAKFDNFRSRASLVRQANGSFLLSGPFIRAGETEQPSFVHLNTLPLPRLANISTRARVSTGENVLIVGFIVSGNAPKTVIVRGIGTSLGKLGLTGVLADPVLQLREPDGTLITNDNWKDSQTSEIMATGFAPQDIHESAIVATLPPGAYTAIESGKNESSGIGLVEVYDLDSGADSNLANVSTRGFVGTVNDVMIGGVIVSGENSQVLVRALGPSLVPFGVTQPLLDPVVELRDADGAVIASNDNWKDTQPAQIRATALPPGDDRESAILTDLVAGSYTAIVSGKGSSTGVALIESYERQ